MAASLAHRSQPDRIPKAPVRVRHSARGRDFVGTSQRGSKKTRCTCAVRGMRASCTVRCFSRGIIVDDVTVADADDPVDVMMAGAAILDRELSPAGFTFHLTRQGHGSGGDFVV